MAIDTLKDFIDSLAAFDTMSEITTIVENNSDRLAELQKEQLASGTDITGAPRRDGYTKFTIQQKQQYGQGLGAVTDHVTFFMTGDLYSSLKTIVSGDQFRVDSPLDTFDKMIERVGEENYGLDEMSRSTFAEEIMLPQFSETLLDKTGLVLL